MRNDRKLLATLMVIVLVGVFGMLARSQPTPADESNAASHSQAKAQPIDFNQGSLPQGSLLASN